MAMEGRPGRGADFWKFWVGPAVSTLGTAFSTLAIPLLIFQLTHSPLNLAITTLTFTLPHLLFGLVVGAWVDRIDRKRLMIVVDVLLALAILVGIPASCHPRDLRKDSGVVGPREGEDAKQCRVEVVSDQACYLAATDLADLGLDDRLAIVNLALISSHLRLDASGCGPCLGAAIQDSRGSARLCYDVCNSGTAAPFD